WPPWPASHGGGRHPGWHRRLPRCYQSQVFPIGGGRHASGDGTPGVNLGGDGRFGSSGSGGPVVDGSRFGPGRGTTGPAVPLVDGSRFGPGGLRGPGVAGLRGGRFGGGSGQGTSIAEAQDTATVTKTVTRDLFVTLTDTALNTIAVTLTDFTVRTSIVQKVQVARTPVDDKVSLRTQVVHRPRTLTVTNYRSYFRIETDVPVTTVTITHSSYNIKQSTYTTTVTQAITYTSTKVQTVVHTLRQDSTAYHTLTNTVLLTGHYPY
ncbi:uncharacterized protein, partial [Panulirus ornatus]|uniref:uncharacterized protein n=1 Tax=Panulirus ornatus TaxID=150431 RepID=UPI003A8B8B59